MTTEMIIDSATLETALGQPVRDYQMIALEGGTLGDVIKVTGSYAGRHTESPGGNDFEIVVKQQRQWERHGDPGCWRREFDIYHDQLPARLPEHIKLARCLLLQQGQDWTRIWMAFISGKTGSAQIQEEELALSARQLGAFQAAFHRQGCMTLPYLRPFPAIVSSFDLWHGHMAQPLCQPIAGFPEALRLALRDYAARAPDILGRLALPRTLCQGDVHHDNLILQDDDVYLIDWDSAGYGYMGEDAVDVLMEAFVYSHRDIALLPQYRQRIMDAYVQGAHSQGVDIRLAPEVVRDICALSWGFRIACNYLYDKKQEQERRRCIDILDAMLL